MRILIIDDEPMLRSLLRDYMDAEGHSTSTASNVAQALALLSLERYDVVLTDNDIPEWDAGLVILERASRLSPKPLLILMSGRAYDDTVVEAARKQGADFVFAKPFSIQEDLLPAISKRLQAA